MGTKVFVGNFSFSIDEAQLKEYFEKAGTVVSARVMTESEGGRSRGFGFVELSSPDEAQKAISELDGSVWEGRVLKVSEDRSDRGGDHHSRRDSSHHSHGGGDNSGQRPAPMGYFRAQPLDLGVRRNKKVDPFIEDPNLVIDYKNPKLLSRFMSERGRILPSRMTGLNATNSRLIKRAIKRSQHLALLPILKQS